MEKKGNRIWKEEDRLFTENLVPGEKVYGEELMKEKGTELREWRADRSKLGAAIMKGMPCNGFKNDSKVLYLGAASGTTTSHVSDICSDGMVFAVEYSHRVIPQLLKNVKKRKNVSPVLGDARKPEEYSGIVDRVDIVFQDVAQPDQFRIFRKNCEKFLKEGGTGIITVKARSVSSSEDPSEVFDEYGKKLEESFRLVWKDSLEPYEKDHMVFMVRKN